MVPLPAGSLAQANRAGEFGCFVPPEKQLSSIPGLHMTKIPASATALPNPAHGDKLQLRPRAVWRGREET